MRFDDERSDAQLDVFAKRHPDDLVDKYRKNEKMQDVMAEMMMGLIGQNSDEKQNSVRDLQISEKMPS